jgi:hypothetical protein
MVSETCCALVLAVKSHTFVPRKISSVCTCNHRLHGGGTVSHSEKLILMNEPAIDRTEVAGWLKRNLWS